MPIFRVKSVKNYTGQKNLHEYIRGVCDKYQVWGRDFKPWKYEDLEYKGLRYTRIQAATHHLKKNYLFQSEKWTQNILRRYLGFARKGHCFDPYRFRVFFQINFLLVWKTNLPIIKILNIPINRDLYGLVWDLNWPHVYILRLRPQVHTILHTAWGHVQTSATDTGALHRYCTLPA